VMMFMVLLIQRNFHINITSSFKADTQDGFCSRSMLQDQFARLVHTEEYNVGIYSMFVQFARDLDPKQLTGLTLWCILQGGNFAPENELRP